ncbi:MAG: cytochrome c biogenesis protein ResB, partial [Actinobacteria bacterium]|nr:cytochrome c biogenesis protein ResB [Actinomycetota bacterium]
GDTVNLPNGWGTITWEQVSAEDPVKRFASLQIQHDPSSAWVLGFAILALAGLITGLLVPRRRLWVKAQAGPNGVRIEYAGLARGDDPLLQRAVDDLAARHAAQLTQKEVINDAK